MTPVLIAFKKPQLFSIPNIKIIPIYQLKTDIVEPLFNTSAINKSVRNRYIYRNRTIFYRFFTKNGLKTDNVEPLFNTSANIKSV